MAEKWANGLDLHLDLPGSRVRARLEAALRDAIRSGRLRSGTRLPSSRVLAADLGVARNTVAEVYSQLVAEGWLSARTGSGTSVASGRAVAAGAAVAAAAAPRHRYDLRPGEPDVAGFPRGAWLAAARKALTAAPDAVLSYGDPRGLPVLRTVLAEYLARVRGVTAEPGNIVICSGFAHGLGAIGRALRADGAGVVAVEEYGHKEHRDIVAAAGLDLRPLPLDRDGAVPAAAAGADAALLTPAHQFPLGMTLHPRRRRAFAQWGGIVIEDDYDGEFRYDRQPVGGMHALAPDRVIYCGTASKSLAPAVRLAWLVVPPWLLDAVVASLGGGPSALDQLTLAEFVASGAYDRQIRRARLAYRRRRDRLVAALAPLGLRVSGIAAGLHALLDFPITASELQATTRARAHGLALDGLSRYGYGDGAGGERAGLVLGYARPPEHAYTAALARLCAVLAALAGSDMITRKPCGSARAASATPPCTAAISATIDRPSPEPGRPAGAPARWNRPKTCGSWLAGTPGPSSLTSIVADPPLARAVTEALVPGGVCVLTLASRLSTARLSSSSSPATGTRAPATSACQRRAGSATRAFATRSLTSPARSTGSRWPASAAAPWSRRASRSMSSTRLLIRRASSAIRRIASSTCGRRGSAPCW